MFITVSAAPRREIPPFRRLRYERRLSIKELSEITGLSPNTIYRLETGERTTPSKETLGCVHGGRSENITSSS